jgi:hypothetical protein
MRRHGVPSSAQIGLWDDSDDDFEDLDLGSIIRYLDGQGENDARPSAAQTHSFRRRSARGRALYRRKSIYRTSSQGLFGVASYSSGMQEIFASGAVSPVSTTSVPGANNLTIEAAVGGGSCSGGSCSTGAAGNDSGFSWDGGERAAVAEEAAEEEGQAAQLLAELETLPHLTRVSSQRG